ncbi:MAG: hypothetical protein GY700_05530, partial [Propionibacteriaceae bacterium]|nr:hypothetical protein [Propionibacteriaceae bacterium]
MEVPGVYVTKLRGTAMTYPMQETTLPVAPYGEKTAQSQSGGTLLAQDGTPSFRMVMEVVGVSWRQLWNKPGQSVFMPEDLHIKAIHIAAMRPDFANMHDVSLTPLTVETEACAKWVDVLKLHPDFEPTCDFLQLASAPETETTKRFPILVRAFRHVPPMKHLLQQEAYNKKSLLQQWKTWKGQGAAKTAGLVRLGQIRILDKHFKA